ncbi:MAG: ornithine cyclodeaminase family protein [Hyphomicrobiales bacterium]|nr:ornithine cyclodeaminase family protein [Hyphomicrobiales bacterium]
MTILLNNPQVEALLSMPECIAILEDAYVELAAGRGITRRRSDSLTPTGRADAVYGLKTMDGVAPKFGVAAVRINSDIVTWPDTGTGRRRVKVPAAPNGRFVGLVLLFSTETSEPLAILPDGVLQRMRVGATNGLAAKYLARADARSVGLIGSGWQAGAQLMAIKAVRPIEKVRCYSPNAERRAAFCKEMGERLGIEVTPVSSPEAAIGDCDVAMCATSAIEHVFFERWVAPGLHVSSIKRPEIEPAAIRRADRLFIHTHDATPQHVTTRGLPVAETTKGMGWKLADEIDFASLDTLPDLVAGTVDGRQNDDQVTCFINNLGLGYQFAAVGSLVHRKAREQGVGRDMPTDWFTEDVHP